MPDLLSGTDECQSYSDPRPCRYLWKNPKTFQPKNKGLVIGTFNWDEEEVSDEEEVTQVKVLMALADDELTVRKSHARNGEWVYITTRKLNHALQEQLKEEKKINEKWLTSSKKVSQCINEQIPHQKKKVLGGELLTDSSSKKNENENIFVPASIGHDQEMVPKTKDWVKRLNPDSKLPNFNSGRILIPESQAVNGSLETSNTLESSKDSEAEFLTSLPPLKILQGASPSLKVLPLNFQPHSPKQRPCLGIKKHTKPETQDSPDESVLETVTVKYKKTTPSVPTKVKDTKQESKLNKLTKLVQMLIDEKVNSDQKSQESNLKIQKAESREQRQSLSDHAHTVVLMITCLMISRNYPECKICRSYDHSTSGHNHVIQIRGGVLVESSQSNESSIRVKFNIYRSTIHSTSDYNESDHFKRGTNVQNDQIITQPIDVSSGNNAEVSRSINEPLVLDATQSHITNQASTSSHPVPQDRWSRDQHIELVNIIGDPGKGMLTRSMAAKLTAALAGTLVSLPYGKITIGSKWVFINKKDKHGTTTKNKERLVAQEYSQEEGIDYDETFAPVARMETIRIFLAFATYMNFKVYQMDVKSAFLNGKLKEEVYVKQPFSFESSEFPDYVCKLDKALYGLKQAPRSWYETLFTFFIQNKFARGRIDNTLFIYKSKGAVLLVQVMIGELTYFLGLKIKQDDKGILIFQELYTRNLLKKYEISDSSSVKTPMVPPNNLGPDLAGKSVNKTSYRGMIGSLMYLTAIRPDIQFSTVLCLRYQSNPKESHLIAVKRILRYLKGTPTLGLYYPKCSGFDLKGYSDSDYAGCNIDRKNTLAEAEYVVDAGCCAMVYQNILREFWSIIIAFDLFLSIDEPEKRPLKEFLIKLSVSNGHRPLTIDFKTFHSSTSLDYNNGKYVDHPTPKVVKKELGKITINPSYLDKTPILKNSFPVAWRILFTFVIQVLGGNYSSIKQVNFIQQLLVYSLITGTEVDIGEIIYSDLVTNMGFPSTLNKGTRLSKPFPEGTATHPKDSEGNKQPLNRDKTFTTSNEGMAKTTPRPEGSLGDKDSGGNISPANMEPIHLSVADLSGTGAKYHEVQTQSSRLMYRYLTKNKDEAQESNEEVLVAEDDIDEDPQDDKEEEHKEEAVSYVNLKASIDQYYDENIAHRDQTDKLVEASMSSLDRSSTTIIDLYKGLNVIIELLKNINTAVKDDPATNQKINEAFETFARISSNVTGVLSLVKGFDFSALMSDVKALRDHASKMSGVELSQTALKQEILSFRQDTLKIKSMMTEMYAAFYGQPSSAPSGSVTPKHALTNIQAHVKGKNANTTATEEPPSHNEEGTEELRLAIPISSTINPPTQAQPITS
nr:hypothetical protein [Tanacetum cinerariifolium]